MNACIDQDDSNQKLDALDLKDFLLQETLFYFSMQTQTKNLDALQFLLCQSTQIKE